MKAYPTDQANARQSPAEQGCEIANVGLRVESVDRFNHSIGPLFAEDAIVEKMEFSDKLYSGHAVPVITPHYVRRAFQDAAVP